MRCLLLGIAAVVVGGCGSGTTTDYAPNFVGTWNGNATVTANGQNQTAAASLPITASGTNALSLGQFCTGGASLPATATSAVAFTIGAFSCPTTTIGTCTSVVQSVTSGSGTLNGTTLSVSAAGNLSGCSQSIAYTITFSGTK